MGGTTSSQSSVLVLLCMNLLLEAGPVHMVVVVVLKEMHVCEGTHVSHACAACEHSQQAHVGC